MAKLLFKNDKGLQTILKYTREASVFRNDFNEAVKAYKKLKGKEYVFGDELPDECYRTDKPTLWLVKDQGVYLMTSSKDLKHPATGHICYAEGYSPNDARWWDKGQAISGDDFVDTIDFGPDMQKAVEEGSDIEIIITATQLTVSTKRVLKGK